MSLKQSLELRTIGTSTNIPKEVFDRVLIRLKDECPFFKHATFMLANDNNKITIISETNDEQYETVNLELQSLREKIKVSTELYQHSDDIEVYLEEKIYNKILESMSKKFGTELSVTPGTANKVQDTLGVPMLLKMRRQLKTSYLNQAVWVVDRQTYNSLMEMQIDNKPLVKSKTNPKTGLIELEMLGHLLYVVENISSDVKIAFVNLKRGFVVRVLNNLSVKKLAEVGYVEGAQIYALDTMYCGKVIETAAIVQGNYITQRELEQPEIATCKLEKETVTVTNELKEEPVEVVKEKVEKQTKKTRGRKPKKEDDK